MLEDAERRYKALQSGQQVSQQPSDVAAKLERVLRDLPERVQAYLADLETFLAQQHVAEGRTILANLETEVLIRADGTAEIAGDLRKALALVVPKRDRESVFRWSGERESNPHPRLGRPELYH